VTPRLAIALALFTLVAAQAARVTACDLDRAAERFWGDLAVGDLVEMEATTGSPGDTARTITIAEVVKAPEGLSLRVLERFEGEATAPPGGTAIPRVETNATSIWTRRAGKPPVFVETRIAMDGGKPTKPRDEEIPPAKAANRLPGATSYCVEGPELSSEAIQTPAGKFTCKQYRVGDARLWISSEVPMGGLVKLTVETGEGKMDQQLIRMVKGKR
jgi:hypothetical protein